MLTQVYISDFPKSRLLFQIFRNKCWLFYLNQEKLSK
nr:MAG TPA: hypothetical protein [Caudoviricetes sp.]